MVEFFMGIVGYIAGVPVVVLGFFITWVLLKLSGAQPSHPIVGDIQESSPLLLYGLASVMAPIVEETMFRGALFHHLRRRWSWLPATLLVSFIFAIIHPQGWTLVPTLGAIALVLAGLREWRGSIIAAPARHRAYST